MHASKGSLQRKRGREKKERERDRDRERQRETERDRERQKETERERETPDIFIRGALHEYFRYDSANSQRCITFLHVRHEYFRCDSANSQKYDSANSKIRSMTVQILKYNLSHLSTVDESLFQNTTCLIYGR